MIAKILKRKVSRIHMEPPDPSQLSTSPSSPTVSSSSTAAAAAKLSTSPSANGHMTSLPLQYKYQRPEVLSAGYSEEDLASFASHVNRPVVGPPDGPVGPVGYAETINAGKSKLNEDQATVHEGKLVRSESYSVLYVVCFTAL